MIDETFEVLSARKKQKNQTKKKFNILNTVVWGKKEGQGIINRMVRSRAKSYSKAAIKISLYWATGLWFTKRRDQDCSNKSTYMPESVRPVKIEMVVERGDSEKKKSEMAKKQNLQRGVTLWRDKRTGPSKKAKWKRKGGQCPKRTNNGLSKRF